MGKFRFLLIVLFSLFCGLYANADQVNIIKNPGFEAKTFGWSKTGAGTFSVSSTTPLVGAYSGLWDASATGEFLQTSLYALDAGQFGRNCLIEMFYQWDAGTTGQILMEAHDGTSIISSTSVTQTVAGTAGKLSTLFTCPTSGSLRFRLESTANAASIKVDGVFIGTGAPLLIPFVGDSGSGGKTGIVPAPVTGDATKFLKGNGTWAADSGTYLSQEFTASGSFVVPAGVTVVKILTAGAGGGGGGGGGSGSGVGGGGGGGGGAGDFQENEYIVTPGETATVTIGAGGTSALGGGVSSAGNQGGTGGTTTITFSTSAWSISTTGGNGGSGGGGSTTSPAAGTNGTFWSVGTVTAASNNGGGGGGSGFSSYPVGLAVGNGGAGSSAGSGSPGLFGGGGGGAKGTASNVQPGGNGGRSIQLPGAAGGASLGSSQGGGGGGGGSCIGMGGVGATATAVVSASPGPAGANGTRGGGGGGGAGHTGGTGANGGPGGVGGDGYARFTWTQ